MFGRDQSGNVAMLFGLMLPALMVGTGGGIELSRAVEYKQRLISATDLACRQAEVYLESLPVASLKRADYSSEVKNYGNRNKTEKNLDTATITATAQTSISNTTLPADGVRPGNVHVESIGKIDLIFKNFLSKDSLTFTVSRDCTVDATASSGAPTLLMSESFEGRTSQLSGGWRIFDSLAIQNCESSLCQKSSWAATGAGLEVNELAGLTGDGVVYGKAFAELDSDCSNRAVSGGTSEQNAACKQGNTNSSLGVKMNLTSGTTYEIRYTYVSRKCIPASATGVTGYKDALCDSENGTSGAYWDYRYPDDPVICSKSTDTTYSARNNSVAKTKAGDSTQTLDKQTRRIELYVEPKSSGYDFDQVNMVDVCVWTKAWTERSYRFTAAATSEYRISWLAAGADDTYGGLIDYLRICQNACP